MPLSIRLRVLSLFLGAACFFCAEGFIHEFDDRKERGPLIRFQPSADETGTPLAVGAYIQTELSLTVWLDGSADDVDAEVLIPVQVGVWLDQELTPQNDFYTDGAAELEPLNELTIADHCGCRTDDDDSAEFGASQWRPKVPRRTEGTLAPLASSNASSRNASFLPTPIPSALPTRLPSTVPTTFSSVGPATASAFPTSQPTAMTASASEPSAYPSMPSSPSPSDGAGGPAHDDDNKEPAEDGNSCPVGPFQLGGALPRDPTRLYTFWLYPNTTTAVSWNVTIDEEDMSWLSSFSPATRGTITVGAYHFGISSCSPLQMRASGFVTWARSKELALNPGRGGSLPSGILGIVPFYGCLSGVYLPLCLLWARRVRQYWNAIITLQLTLFVILVANWIYTLLAFSYYLHLDLDTNVTAEQVFGGIYAGFYRFREDPFAVVVASYR